MSKEHWSEDDSQKMIELLQSRFHESKRFEDLDWNAVNDKLQQFPDKIWSLAEMERTGGEPQLFEHHAESNTYFFCDFSAESPQDRRSLCYDQAALESRKKFKPRSSAVTMAEEYGIKLMDSEQYQRLQTLGEFDTKTSSWLRSPSEIRELGGAIFGDRRYGQVFIYHNGAESYYAARGFRGILEV